MPSSFNGTSFLLTFPQSKLSKDTVSQYFNSLPNIQFVKVAQETHDDGLGSIHYHVLIHYSSKQRFSHSNFDAIGEHPNIKPVGRKKTDWDNCVKYLDKEDKSCFVAGAPRHDSNIWSTISSSSTREEASSLLIEHKPRDAILNAKAFDYWLDKMFPMRLPSSSGIRTSDQFILPDSIETWCTTNFRSPRPERPRSLVLVGTSRLGKTQWARSLGEHAYVANQWNLDSFDGLSSSFWDFGYVVFDDIEWESLRSSAKSWFGAQRDFSVSDKYRRKRRMKGGIPSILLVNPEEYSGPLCDFCNSSWGKENIDVIVLNNKLY